ncbi:MAG: Tyrosine-protein kinase wzc [Syntrophorhabdus sp. PtaB.Bin006]|nr:MAG: Tyrosine-protein kinase wzc [Syntrophorhabdus sp. PtaB.Bin006]
MEEERAEVQSDEVNILDYLIVLAKHKILIFCVTMAVAVITAIVSLVMTPVYRAETKILPPAQGSGTAAQFLSQFGGVGALAGSSFGIKAPNDLYIGLTKSRTVLDRIIDRFNLMILYKAKNRDDARGMLRGGVLDVEEDDKSGIITITVEDKNPKRAAEMANAFVEELRRLNTGLAVTEASQRRLFFEEQLKAAKISLAQAEAGLKTFQEETGAFNIESQAKAIIEGIGALRAQIAAKEVELKVMKTYSTPQNPDVQRVEQTLNGLKAELGKLESRGGKGHDPLMPTGRMAQIGTDYARQLRDVKFNEVLYGLLLQQYEAAKLDEAKDATIIQVVDKAVPPEIRTKPKRTLMVVFSAIVAFFVSVLGAFLVEYYERSNSNPEDRERIDALKKHLAFRRRA